MASPRSRAALFAVLAALPAACAPQPAGLASPAPAASLSGPANPGGAVIPTRATDHAGMAGMDPGMDHGTMPGMDHRMPGMDHRSMARPASR